MKLKILIGDVSSYKAIVICKYIKTHYNKFTIYTYDTKKFTKTIITKYSDRHYIVNAANFENDLKHIIDFNNIDFFFPVNSDSLSKLWKNKFQFGNTLSYLGDFKAYEILNNKVLLNKLAEELGLPVPARYVNISIANPPFVIKPANLSSSKGVVYVKSENDFPRNINYNNLIIQQYVEGVGVGYSFYCKKGEILNGYGHRRIAEYPVTGGSSTYREGYLNNEMVKIASKIIADLNYTGFAMFEFKLTSDDKIYLIEVNPRIWGSINQGLMNGVNYFSNILGETSKNNTKNTNKNTYLSPLFYLSLTKYILKFNFTPLQVYFKNFFINRPDVSILDDPLGYLSLLLRRF